MRLRPEAMPGQVDLAPRHDPAERQPGGQSQLFPELDPEGDVHHVVAGQVAGHQHTPVKETGAEDGELPGEVVEVFGVTPEVPALQLVDGVLHLELDVGWEPKPARRWEQGLETLLAQCFSSHM